LVIDVNPLDRPSGDDDLPTEDPRTRINDDVGATGVRSGLIDLSDRSVSRLNVTADQRLPRPREVSSVCPQIGALHEPTPPFRVSGNPCTHTADPVFAAMTLGTSYAAEASERLSIYAGRTCGFAAEISWPLPTEVRWVPIVCKECPRAFPCASRLWDSFGFSAVGVGYYRSLGKKGDARLAPRRWASSVKECAMRVCTHLRPTTGSPRCALGFTIRISSMVIRRADDVCSLNASVRDSLP